MQDENDASGERPRSPGVLRQMSLAGRPPYLSPRPRPLGAEEAGKLRRWLGAELALAPGARVDIVEYVSFDSREVPHTTLVSVVSEGRQLAFSIGKPAAEVGVNDLPLGLRRRRNTATLRGEKARPARGI